MIVYGAPPGKSNRSTKFAWERRENYPPFLVFGYEQVFENAKLGDFQKFFILFCLKILIFVSIGFILCSVEKNGVKVEQNGGGEAL